MRAKHLAVTACCVCSTAQSHGHISLHLTATDACTAKTPPPHPIPFPDPPALHPAPSPWALRLRGGAPRAKALQAVVVDEPALAQLLTGLRHLQGRAGCFVGYTCSIQEQSWVRHPQGVDVTNLLHLVDCAGGHWLRCSLHAVGVYTPCKKHRAYPRTDTFSVTVHRMVVTVQGLTCSLGALTPRISTLNWFPDSCPRLSWSDTGSNAPSLMPHSLHGSGLVVSNCRGEGAGPGRREGEGGGSRSHRPGSAAHHSWQQLARAQHSVSAHIVRMAGVE